jgi:hypothetical protein
MGDHVTSPSGSSEMSNSIAGLFDALNGVSAAVVPELVKSSGLVSNFQDKLNLLEHQLSLKEDVHNKEVNDILVMFTVLTTSLS